MKTQKPTILLESNNCCTSTWPKKMSIVISMHCDVMFRILEFRLTAYASGESCGGGGGGGVGGGGSEELI